MSQRFSERIAAVKVEIQVGTMSPTLRNTIWNFVTGLIPGHDPRNRNPGVHQSAVRLITAEVLRVPLQRIDYSWPLGWLLKQVESMTWAEVYDLLQFAVDTAPAWRTASPSDAIKSANVLLEREHSGYRFVNGLLAPITDSVEITEIEEAAKRAAGAGLDGVREQIAQAVMLFGQRPTPDYRNAVKEAISAVEGVVKLINGSRGGSLRDALEAVSAKIEMHPALKTGLDKLYGYTSDEDGIRHAILEEASVDEAEARFMVVTCSAFVNFLIVRADASGLLTSPKR